MKIKLTIHIILLNICFLTNLFSQSRTNYINFETLNVENGLSQNYINCIFQDHEDFIWIGTTDGLNRYDGVNFLKYYKDIEIENSISGSQITDIVEDINNNLWISTKNNGLNKLSPDRKIFTTYFNNPQETNYLPEISILEYDGKNKIWVVTKNKIFSFDILTEKLQEIDLDLDSNLIISDFIIAENNNLWIASNKNYFFCYDVEKNKISKKYYLNDSITITTIYKAENRIIIGTFENELIIYDLEINKSESIFKSVVLKDMSNFLLGKDTSVMAITAMDICVDNQNKILIGGREGLVSLNYFTENVGSQKLTTELFELDFAANCIMTDKSGNIWIGTNGKGVRIFNEKFKNFKANYNFDDFQNYTGIKSIRTISENTDYLFVGGYYGLVFINKKTFEITDFLTQINKINPKLFFNPNGVKFNPAVYCLLPDPELPNEILWIGVEGYCSGLYRFDLKNKTIKHYAMNGDKEDFMANHVFDICDDENGNIWIATDYGAYKFNRKTEEFTYFQNKTENPNSIQSSKITTIYKDSKDRLWFGSVNDGVSYYDESTGNFIHLRENKNSTNSLPSNTIISIYEDKKNNYWFGTMGSGLAKFDFETKTFIDYTISDGLPNNVVYGILEDNNENLWLSTNSGLSRFNIEIGKFTNFSTSDGLVNIEYNTGAVYKSNDGTMFFGGINGFDYFNPENIYKNDYQPPIMLTSIKINNIEISQDTTLNSIKLLEVSYLDNFFSVEFAGLSYFQSEKNEYVYMLEGINSDWIYIGNENSITFNGLKSGHYTLKIKACNNEGVWNESAFELPIYIKPPFWEKWWFIAFIMVLMLFFVLLTLRIRRIKYLKKQNELEFVILERTSEIENQKEELQVNADNLKRAFEIVNKLSKTKDNMSSMLVHDLKNPLNSIINYARLIRKSEKEQFNDIKEKTNEIEKSSLNMLNLVNNLMDISKMEEDKMRITITENSLYKVINEALQQTKFILTEKNIELENKISDNIVADFDYDLIVRVLVNLISNAIKFSESNSKIIIENEIIENVVKIKITDFGKGIPEEHLINIFNKFVQCEVRKLGITQSTGLGLTFSKLAIEAHNQQIGVVSKINEGSTFWFTLKLLSVNNKCDKIIEIYENKILYNNDFINDEILETKKILNSFRFFQTGEIFSTFTNSKYKSIEFLEWKKEVEKAVLYTNEKYYNELIKPQ